MERIKNKILDFYSFKEDVDGEIFCVLEDRSTIIFKFSPQSNTVDLFLRKHVANGIFKEEGLVKSFSFKNKEHISTLNILYNRRLKQM